MPTLALVHLDSVVQNTIGISIPLAIALAWGVNIFGVLGTGMPWLSSQPKIMKYLPRIAALLQFLLTFILLTALWAVSLISKNTTVSNAPIVLLMGAASAALVTAVSLDLSIRRPIRTRLSGRGDALVPPITALAYMIRLVALALIPTVVTAAGLNKTKETIAFIAMFLFSIIILAIQEYRWNNPEVRANVVIKVSAA
jgi:small basic protein